MRVLKFPAPSDLLKEVENFALFLSAVQRILHGLSSSFQSSANEIEFDH